MSTPQPSWSESSLLGKEAERVVGMLFTTNYVQLNATAGLFSIYC